MNNERGIKLWVALSKLQNIKNLGLGLGLPKLQLGVVGDVPHAAHEHEADVVVVELKI